MRPTWLLPPLFLALSACGQAPPPLLPAPMGLSMEKGTCSMECPWKVEFSEKIAPSFRELVQHELDALHPPRTMDCFAPLPIDFRQIQPDTLLPREWYFLNVRPDGITVEATNEEGLFRGSRTVIQLLEQGRESGSIPCLSITDQPRFRWRGMHLDVCRHFFPVDFVKEYIDLLARYKMNTFHWHLTDDQGWRMEIKKHPKLTEVGAWRSGSQYGPYADQTFDSTRYGGFYTQEQIRDVVAYAAARHITIVPEIEMPGHALAALAAYPQYGCTGGPYEVNKGWGVFEDVFCAGNDGTFELLEDVLAEVIELFPGEYIHVGGDECPKERWKACPKCQARMKAEGLKDGHELQSYFVQRIEQFVNAKGRKIIGWDEILEGGLAPNAAVMSWRGIDGGKAAARQHHQVVMCPGSHCYFDHYQGDPANEPLAIGGYTTVQKVYSYEPVPDSLTADEARYILGAQGNVWTEYITTTDHVEYMALPRMIALAEVLWSPKEKRDEKSFIRRLETEFPKLEAKRMNASKSLYQVAIKIKPSMAAGKVSIELNSMSERPMWYGLRYDRPEWVKMDTQMNAYVGPFEVFHDCEVHAGVEYQDHVSKRALHFNLATARPITCAPLPNERYAEGGAFTLVDGVTAGPRRVNYEWLGWLAYRTPVTITVDLGEVKDFTYAGIGALAEESSWIHLPQQVKIETSTDSLQFQQIAEIDGPAEAKGRIALNTGGRFRARYVRFMVRGRATIPEGLPGAGEAPWLFLDEITVR